MRIILITIFISTFLSGISQIIPIDSLKNVLSKAKTDTEKIKIMNDISRRYWNKNNSISLQYSKRALEKSTEINYKKGVAMSLANIGIASLYDNDKKNSLDNLLKALKIYQELNDSISLKAIYINIGSILYSLGKLDEAKSYLEKGLKLYLSQPTLKKQDSLAIVVIYNNISLCYLDRNKLDSAVNMQFEALKIRRALNNKEGIAISYANLGLMYEQLDSLDLAEKYFKEAIKLQREIKNYYGLAFSKIDLASFYRTQGKIDTSLQLIQDAIDILEDKKIVSQLPRAYLVMSKIYEDTKNYEKALKTYKKYVIYKDSIANKPFYDDIAKIQEEYKKELEIRKEQSQEFELKKQKIIRNAMIVIAVFVIVLIIVLLNRYKIKIKSEKELQKLNSEKDKFFTILAHDLRSPIQGMVTLSEAIINNFDVLTKKELLSYNKNLNKTAKSISYLLENLLDWAMSQINKRQYFFESLELKELAFQGVNPLLESAKRKSIDVNVEINSDIKVYADANSLRTIFRNLTNNAIKFTKNGGEIIISAKQNANSVELSIKDTGVGMSADALNHLFDIGKQKTTLGTDNEKGTGFGLLIVKELVSKNKGTIKVLSKENEGTEL